MRTVFPLPVPILSVLLQELYLYNNKDNREADIHKTKLIKKADKAPHGKHDKSKKSRHDEKKNK